ncbi:unnamed protein product [Symbiodinium sp. KB8]|nr:unnamed protein product [Symbiodinium sp. KB8]
MEADAAGSQNTSFEAATAAAPMDETTSYAIKARNVVFPRTAEEARELFRAGIPGDQSLHLERHKILKQSVLPLWSTTVVDEEAEEYDDTSYPAFGDEADYEPHSYPAAEEEEDPSYEEYELDEDEALALNCLEELDPVEAESGHAIQRQLAANAAFGEAKGRKGKGRGKGKSKGKHQGKNRANIAIVAPRQAAPAQPSSSMQMEGIPEGTYNPRPRGKGSKKVPPNPPKAVSEKLVEATEQDRVSQPIALEERIHPAALHEWLREATTAVLTGARPAPSGDLPRPPWLPEAAPETQSGGTPAEPEFYRARHEAILLESFRADGKLHDPFPGDSSDDGAPGSYNVEELDDALERQAAEDAQKELDEAFERARQQIAADDPLLSSALPRPLRISLVFVMWPAENSSACSIRPAIQSMTIDTDRQSKTAMGPTVLKLTPGSVDANFKAGPRSRYPFGTEKVRETDLLRKRSLWQASRRMIHRKEGWQDSDLQSIRILGGILETRSGRTLLSLCFADIEKAVDGYKLTIILPFCTSNRHRSVAIGTLISANTQSAVDTNLYDSTAEPAWPTSGMPGSRRISVGIPPDSKEYPSWDSQAWAIYP